MRKVTRDKIYYSDAFKQKVVGEVLRGKFTIDECRRVYDIGGPTTIQRWMKKLGKEQHLGRVVRIEMKDEKDKIKELEKKLKEYEKVISNQEVKLLTYEALLEIGKEKYGIDLKKKTGQDQ